MLMLPLFSRLPIPLRWGLPVVLSLTACDEGTPPPVYSSPTPDPGQIAQPFQPGTFAAIQVLSQKVAKLVGNGFDTQTLVGYKIVRLDIGEAPDTATYTETKFCYEDVSEASDTCSILSAGTYAYAPVTPFTANLSYEGAAVGEALVVGATLDIPLQASLSGVTMDDPLNDPMPTSMDDPRIFDSDRDGNPGFTLTVSGFISGDLWGTERLTFGCSGVLLDADHVSGTIFGRSDAPSDHVDYYENYEGRIVEDVFFYGSSFLIPIDTQIEPNTDPGTSYFELKRVPDNFTCEDFKAQAESLFTVQRSTCFDWK